MSSPSVKPDPERPEGGHDHLVHDSLRQAFEPMSADGGQEDEFLDWFALDWDEEDSMPAAVGPVAESAAECEAHAELPIHLAAPLRSGRRALAEVAVGFIALVTLELLFGTGVGSHELQPHPYWLVILPIAAARGLVAGLVAASLGTVLLLGGAMHALALENWIELLDYRHGMTPLGFFLAAFLVGQVRDTLAVRYDELWRHAIRSATDRARAAARLQRLVHANRDLKVRLLDHGAQFGHLLEAAKRLDSATPKALFEVALDMVLDHCGGEKCCVIDTRGDALRIVAIRGWLTDDLARLSEAAARSPAIRAAAQAGQRFNVFASEETAGSGDPLLIAPLCAEDGTVEALLCLDALAPDRFSQSMASVFFGIGEWAQLGIQRLAAGLAGVYTPDGHALLRSYAWVGNAEDLPARLRVEDGRLTETGMTTCLVPIHALIDGNRKPDQRKLDQLLESTILNGVLRGADSLYRLPEPGSWVLVLPATPKSAARVVRRRVEHLLGQLRFGQVCGFRTDVVAPEPWRGTLAELAPALSQWVRDPALDAIPRVSSANLPASPAILDAVEFARRVQVEGCLGRRHETEFHVVELDFELVPVERPEAVTDLLTTFADRFLSKTATVHVIEGNRFALVLPYTRSSGAFRAVYELSRSVATSLGLPTNQGVRFGVFALGGRPGEADTLLLDLFHIKGRRMHENPIAAPAQQVAVQEARS